MPTILLAFLALFSFFLIPGYLLPAGYYYWLYHLPASDAANRPQPLQSRRPTPGQVAREIKLSVLTVAIFAAMSTGVFVLYQHGWTKIYLHWNDYPLWYFFLSIVLCGFIFDTYFYWTHRLMHWRPIFKYVHLGHHRSVSPTPWAIYAFQPTEAVIQFLVTVALVVFLPLHPVALFVFLFWNTLTNVAGHTGYELMPPWISSSVFFRGMNTVAHHDTHHTHLSKNFGAFFNWWDRMMGTFLEERQNVAEEVETSGGQSHPTELPPLTATP